jgi:hypothetical protein
MISKKKEKYVREIICSQLSKIFNRGKIIQ